MITQYIPRTRTPALPRLAALAVALAVVTAGCASQEAAPGAAESEFVVEMAINASTSFALAELAEAKAKDPQVRELAATVSRGTAPIVDELTELGPALAADGAPGFAHDDETDHDHAREDPTVDLRSASPKSFDARFLTLLRTELDAGLERATKARTGLSDPRTLAMAERVVETWAALQADAASMKDKP